MKRPLRHCGALVALVAATALVGCAGSSRGSRTSLNPLSPRLTGETTRANVSDTASPSNPPSSRGGSALSGPASRAPAAREVADPFLEPDRTSRRRPEPSRESGHRNPSDTWWESGPPDSSSPVSPVSPTSLWVPDSSPPAAASSVPDGPRELPPVVRPADVPRPNNPASSAVIRGQSPTGNSPTPGTGDYWRFPMAPSGMPVTRAQYDGAQPWQPTPGGGFPPGATSPTAVNTGPNDFLPLMPDQPTNPGTGLQPFNQPTVDLNVNVEEARTGRFMFGAAVNSDLGLTGQIVIDERNFNPWRMPTSWDDVVNGTAWRGAGHGFRLEAMPGNQLQRYLATYTIPYLWMPGIAEPFVLNTSGFYFTRRYFDWSEQRLGGRVSLGYRVTPDLSLTTSLRAEEVVVYNPRVLGVSQLDEVVGSNELYSGRVTLSHDTRDNAFLATQGHYFELAYEQTFGTFDYPRGELDYRQYFLMRERPDGTGRHTLAYSFRLGFSGAQTPIFENYFSGGYSTMRGFDFRGASPVGPSDVQIGGQFRFLGSMEYFFPLTADDMIKAVVFCDFGTTEEEIELQSQNYRVSPGIGLRLNIPAMGPAPLAMDLAFPVARASTDDVQNFSFFFGFSR